jgi:hypothetical protein
MTLMATMLKKSTQDADPGFLSSAAQEMWINFFQ